MADESSSGGRTAFDVELCQCPPGYSGTSCEVSLFHNLEGPEGSIYYV